MNDERYWKLVSQLRRRTQDRSLQWEPLGDSSDEFVTSLAAYSVSISTRERHDDQREEGVLDVVITIRNGEGDVIETFSDIDVRADQGQSAFKSMLEIFEFARRQAMGVDSAINDILQALENS